jgi:hypothetical protein
MRPLLGEFAVNDRFTLETLRASASARDTAETSEWRLEESVAAELIALLASGIVRVVEES